MFIYFYYNYLMTYIAFIGYNESDFNNFKIGNKTIQFCRKEDYPDPSDYLIRNAQKIGIDGERCIENMLNKIKKNKMFNDFELYDTHATPHSGDYLFINKKNNICFMIECKNKLIISAKEDLVKFDNDIDTVRKTYKCNVIGVFLQLGSNSITNHKCIELNQSTVYLTKDYINKTCLEIIFNNYITINDNKTNITNNDCSFIETIINHLENIESNNDIKIKRIQKVIIHNNNDILSLSKVINEVNAENETIKNIISLYHQYLDKQKEEQEKATINDNDSVDSLESIQNIENNNDDIDDIFDFPTNNIDSKSCIVTNKNKGESLFKQLKTDNKKPSGLKKGDLQKHYSKYLYYINSNTIENIRYEYKKYLSQTK